MTPEDEYKHRIAVIRTLDVQAFEAELTPAQLQYLVTAVPPETRQLALLGAMHKVRRRLPEASDEERVESDKWLRDNNMAVKPKVH